MFDLLDLGLHPRIVDTLTVDEFEFIVGSIERARAAAAQRQQSPAVATIQALGGSA